MSCTLIRVTMALAALAAGVPAAATNDKGEARLAKVLEGRVPGQPVHCLDQSQRRDLEIVDRTALVFKDGSTYYVNRPSGVNFLTWSDVPVFDIRGSQLCSMDIVHLHDRSTGMGGAAMSLGEFIPYKRVG